MSNEYINGVIAHSQSKRSARAVLIAIANRAQADGTSRPGLATIADEAGVSERTATRAIAQLIEMGELELSEKNRQHHSPQYRILLQPEKSAQSRQNVYADKIQSRQIDARVDKLSPRVDKLSEVSYTRELEPNEPNGTQGEPAREPEPTPLPEPDPPPSNDIPDYLGGSGRQPHREQRRPLGLQDRARSVGLEPKQFTALTDLLLDLTGKRALADSSGGEGTLREAQETVIALTEMKMGGLDRLREIDRSFWQAHPSFTDPPTFKQFLAHASHMKAGKVRTAQQPAFGLQRQNGANHAASHNAPAPVDEEQPDYDSDFGRAIRESQRRAAEEYAAKQAARRGVHLPAL